MEFDFQGASAQENKGAVLLRHAYWEVKDEEFRLLAGQTWDIISPLYPTTTMYTVYWAAGNIGYRRAQFRGERYLACSDELLLVVPYIRHTYLETALSDAKRSVMSAAQRQGT